MSKAFNLKASLLMGLATLLFSQTSHINANGWPEGFETPDEASGWDPMGDPFEENNAIRTPYIQNGTTDVDFNKIYIRSWETDPPNAIHVLVNDDRYMLNRQTIADLWVEVGDKDELNQFFVIQQKTVKNLTLYPGANKITVYIHNEPNQIIHARLRVRRNSIPIKPIDGI